MPTKYHVETAQVPARFRPVTRSGVIAWEEGCLKCPRCVKKECVYQVYQKRNLDGRHMVDSLDSLCKDCFRCVQNCPNRLIQKGLNPAYRALGDDYWTPELISSIWSQAETGRVPVSGGGYGGTFSGSGFDAMWTDMSEIVRPTRDGIHGREYINTSVDLGRKHMALEFDQEGSLLSPALPLAEIPLPVLFDVLPWAPPRERILLGMLEAARLLGTFSVVRASEWREEYEKHAEHAILFLDDRSRPDGALLARLRLVELPDGKDALASARRLKAEKEGLIVAIRLPLSPRASDRAETLAAEGVEIIHLVADERGREEAREPRFVKDRMREIHHHLVDRRLRDAVTIVAGGGVAAAEHMAKLVICGADAVSCEVTLLVALECRVCRRCVESIGCPVDVGDVDPGWAALRIRNLMAAWHSQLLEILGAMGMREVRRLRGEMGRAMFFEDLEREFADLGRRG